MQVNTQVYSTKEVCARYGVHADTVRKMLKNGTLRAGRAGKKFKFSAEECDRVFLGIEPKEKQ